MRFRRPTSLFDREHEWADLTGLAIDDRPGIHLGIVSGLRRQGKSFLLRALCDQAKGTYHQAHELERTQTLQRFADDVARTRDLPAGTLRFTDWDAALRTALGYPARGSTTPPTAHVNSMLVLDEFPYLLSHSPELPSVLQEIIDEASARSYPPRCVIVCGSSLSVMTGLLDSSRPLRGRAQLNLMVRPFDFVTAAQYWNISDPDLALHVDSVFGGTAGYLPLIGTTPDRLTGFSRWLAKSVLSPSHALFREKDFLLREDPRITDRVVYNSVLAAVASGARSPSQIGSVVARNANQLRHPLEVLTSAGILERSVDSLTNIRPTYRIASPLVRFSEVVQEPFSVLLEQRDVESAWRAALPGFQSQILGPHFESMCREWSARPRAPWNEPAGVVGTAVVNDPAGRSQHEIDVVALARGHAAGRKDARVLVLGEAKASRSTCTTAELDRLRHIQALLAARGLDVADATLAIFSRSGFDATLAKAARRDNRVSLISLADLYA